MTEKSMIAGKSEGQTTGTIEWFSAESDRGAIRLDDGTGHCTLNGAVLRECGIGSVAPGDRVRFRVVSAGGMREAADVTLVRQVDRWENEGGALAGENDAPRSRADDDD